MAWMKMTKTVGNDDGSHNDDDIDEYNKSWQGFSILPSTVSPRF